MEMTQLWAELPVFRALAVLESAAKVLSHSGTNGLGTRSDAQSQLVANGADVISHVVAMCGNIGHSNVGRSNVMSVERA